MSVSGAALAAIVALAVAARAGAQGMASEKGTVSQTIDGTTITLEYYRPVAHGRTPFPDVVHWGRFWTPGANWATTLEVDRPVYLNGNPVSKGKYSVWMIPAADEWTVVLNRDAKRFHTQPPSSSDEETRFMVKPATGAPMETLAFYFPVVTRDGATLDLHWGTTIVAIRVTVGPSHPPEVSDSERDRYVGRYRLTPASSDANLPAMTIEVTATGNRLHAKATPPLWGYDETFDLVPFGHDGDFRLSFFRSGKLFGMETDAQVTFTGDSSRHATGIELTSVGRVVARGTRDR
jgi:hypothetical protein